VTELAQGGHRQADGTGFQPGETVTATLHSTPIALGSFLAGADGSVSFTFIVPADLAPGRHTLTLAGRTSGRTATAGLIVEARPAALADTGSPVTGLLVTAIGLVLVGAAVLAMAHGRIPRPVVSVTRSRARHG
jgi:hypothetical protein